MADYFIKLTPTQSYGQADLDNAIRYPSKIAYGQAIETAAGAWELGAITGSLDVQRTGGQLGNSNSGAAATGTITFASSSGAVGATIGGTLVTVTWATSDAASIVALVAAINANSTVNKWVLASVDPALSTRCLLTALTTPYDHAIGNNITLVASGTNVTVSGAKLGTGGTAVAGVTATSAAVAT